MILHRWDAAMVHVQYAQLITVEVMLTKYILWLKINMNLSL